jgi:octaprenyl-diphosphate synthase
VFCIDSFRCFVPIAQKLTLVEAELQSYLTSDIHIIRQLADHISRGKGKRLRPALLLLCSRLFSVDSKDDVKFATIFELIHTATLIHDDVIDHANTRRGKQTLNAVWGNSLAVLFGDLLYTRSVSAAITSNSFRMLEILSDAASGMIEGELIQYNFLFNLEIGRKEYFDIQERKTALLFAGCAEIAGVIAQRPKKDCEALYCFGLEVGRAFQLVDDLLDYTATSEQMGKPVLSDLKGGRLTLPLLSLLELAPLETTPIIKRIWGEDIDDPIAPEDKKALYVLLERYDAFSEIKIMAKRAAAKANAALMTLDGDQDIKNLLFEVSESLLARSF